MKNNIFKLILFSLIILAIGCSAETVTNLPEMEVSVSDSPLEIQGTGNGLEIRFKPQPYAKAYYYQFDSTEEQKPINNLSLDNGKYSFTVDISGKTVGQISVFAENNSGKRTLVGIGDYAANLSNTTPNACLARRFENKAEIAITPISIGMPIVYKVEISGKIMEETINSVISIPVSSDKNVEAQVFQKLIDDTSWSSPVTITIPAYEKDKYDPNMTMVIGEKTIEVFQIPDSVSEVHLTKNSRGGGISTPNQATVVNNKATFEISDLKSLESGEFFVYYGDDSSKFNSNHINYTSPLTIKKQTNNWQSVELEFDFASDIDISSLEFNASGAVGLKSNVENDGIIKIVGFDSNTDYQTIILSVADYPSNTSTQFSVQTKSFEGTYEWEGTLVNKSGKNPQNTNFKIIVNDSPIKSIYPYYVYFDDEDAAVIKNNAQGQKLRVMPLLDSSMGEGSLDDSSYVNISSPSPFEKQNAAYVLNGKKWNSSSMSPKAWTIKNPDSNSFKDIVCTVTWSAVFNLNPSSLYETTTTFEFKEQSINNQIVPTVLFTNKGSTAVSIGLYKNGSIDESKGEADYTFCLEKVNE